MNAALDYILKTTVQSFIGEKHGPDQKYVCSSVECALVEATAKASGDGGLLWVVRKSAETLRDMNAINHPEEKLGPLHTLHFKMDPPVQVPCYRVFYRLVLS